ncbi:MAG TPA: prepilin-type N-terminal cleavage/methylation domain-containing protein [Planctomycetota bacterium]|nr:prepilin-type N-terminal cleavage/methylation domain-containing protein [Planctomycetota bacterium]
MVARRRPPSAAHCPPPTAGRRSGFTLLELMVVMFIMLLIAGLAVASMRQFLETERIKLAGGTVDSAIRMARQYAMSKRNKCMVEFIDDLNRVDAVPVPHTLYMTADNTFEVYLNGALVGSGTNWQSMQTYPLAPQSGTNVIAVRATNAGGSANPAGLLAELNVDGARSSPSWECRTTAPSDWPFCTDSAQWGVAAVIDGNYGIAPWNNNVNSPAPPAGTPAKWVWNVTSTGNVAVGDVYFRHTFNYVASTPYTPPADTIPRYVRVIPYRRMINRSTGGFTWLLEQDVNALKIMELPKNIHYALIPARIQVLQYDPADLVDHSVAVRKSYFALNPDGTCSGTAPDVEDNPAGTQAHWASFTNTVILRDLANDDLCLMYTPPATAFTRTRFIYGGADVEAFVAAHAPYVLW